MEKSEEKKLPENKPGSDQQAASSSAAQGKNALRRILKKGKRKLKRIKRRLVSATRLLRGKAAQAIDPKGASSHGTPEEFEACVTAAMAETGWSRKKAEAQVRAAARELKLRYVDYAKYHYCQIQPEEQKTYKEIIRNIRRQHLSVFPEEKQRCPAPSLDSARIREIMKKTGWTKDEAITHFLNAYALTGSSLKEYLRYQMYDLDESAQKKVLNGLLNNKLWARYNKHSMLRRLSSSKEFTGSFFAEYFRRAWCVNTAVSFQEFSHRFQNCSRVIYKPVAGSHGTGVEAFDLSPDNIESVYHTLSEYPTGVVEEYVRQHPEMSRLNPDSVNTIRAVSFSSNSFPVTEDGKMMDIAFANVRIGGGGSIVDNFHSGGVTANIDLETGKIRTNAIDSTGKVQRRHSASGPVIKGFEIPYFQEALNMIRDAIQSRQLEGYIGWDVAIAEDGPLLIEINSKPGVGGLQTIYTPLKRGMKPLMEKYRAVDPGLWRNGQRIETDEEAGQNAKASCLKRTMEATGWSEEQALAHIEDARARLGISYREYRLAQLYRYAPADQRARCEAVMARRAKKQEAHEKAVCLKRAIAATGWSEEQALAHIEDARARLGISYREYRFAHLFRYEPADQRAHYEEVLARRAKKQEAHEKAVCLKKTTAATGWSKEEALAHIEDARARLGIGYREYQLSRLYRYEPADQPAHYEKSVARREARRARNEKLYTEIAGETGWTAKQARAKYRKAKKRFGISLEDYCALKLYLTAPEQQMLCVREQLEREEIEERERAASLKLAMRAMHWSEEEAAAKLEESCSKLSVSYRDYRNLKLYRYELDEQERRYRKYVETREQEEKDRAACLKAVVGETGWSREHALSRIEEATKRLGVSYKDYRLMRLYRYAPEKQAAQRDRILAKRAKEKAEKDRLVKAVAEAAGWSFEKAEKRMEKASKSAGISYEQYRQAKLYLYPAAEQERRYRDYLAQREKERRAKAACVKAVSEATGWTSVKAEAQIEDARKRLGVSYQDYRLMRLYRYEPEKQAAQRDRVLAKRAKLQAEKDACIRASCAAMGWDREEAIRQIDEACRRLKISYHDYHINKYYRLDPAQQAQHKERILEHEAAAQRQKAANIDALASLTGWPREEAAAKLNEASHRFGVSYGDYILLRLYNMSPEEQAAFCRFASVPYRLKDEPYIKLVQEKTGWDRETTLAAMARARMLFGATRENYAVYRFWELTEEQQATFFTQGHSGLLRAKFRGSSTDMELFQDKSRCNRYFDAYLGRAWLSTADLSRERFLETFGPENKIIFKPLTGTGGKGVQVFTYDAESFDSLYPELASLPSGIIESFIKQHPDLSRLSVRAVNTLRVCTVMTNKELPGIEKGKVHILYAGLRMAAGDRYVDNLHSNGIIADVDLDTGILKTDGQDFNNKVYATHPDTGCPIKGFRIPFFEEVKKLVQTAGADLEAYLGWDIAISETGPVIVEINTSPGAVILQVPHIMQHEGMRHVVAKYLDA